MSYGVIKCKAPCQMTPFQDEFIVGKEYIVEKNVLGQWHARGETGQICGLWEPFFFATFDFANGRNATDEEANSFWKPVELREGSN